ncbi:MAG: subtilisin family serine protease, partial [Marinoscillum sp.]
MKKILSYGLMLMLSCLVGFSVLGQSSIKKGYLYIKLNPNVAPSVANGTRSFSLSDIEGMEHYEAVKPINKSGRSAPSVLDGLYKVKVSDETNIQALCAKLSKELNVIYAEPIVEFPLLYTPNDPNATDGSQSYLSVIKAFEAWDVTKGDASHVIGIIDTGLDFTHDDIISKVFINTADTPNGIDDDGNGYIDDYRGYNFSAGDTTAQCARSYHGNRVGGLAGADTDNSFGIAGIGFNAKIAALKAYNENTNLIDAGYEAILYAAEMGFDVVNLSYGATSAYSQAGQDLITYAVKEKNMVIVAAAGNSNKNERYYPASFEHVLSVAATSVNDVKSSFSTYHPLVDLVAPGSSVYSTFKLNGFASDNGTSYSSPLVAGTAALVKAAFPTYNASQIMEQIRVTTDDIYDKNPSFVGLLGSGRLNAFRAVSETNTQSARMENMASTSNNGQLIYRLDTVTISFDLTNYLQPIENLKLSFSSQSPYVNFLENEIVIGNQVALATQTYISKFLTITEDLPSETNVIIKVDMTGTDYTDVQYFEISTAPKSLLFDNGSMAIMLREDGSINSSDGISNNFDLKWKDESVAITQGIFVAKDQTLVADNIIENIGQYTFTNDFSARQTFEIEDGVFSDFQISTSFEETTQNGIGIAIEQSTISNASEDFIIQTYRLANQTNDSLKNLSFGYYTDWYLRTFTQNRAYFDSSSQILMAFDKDSTLYAGIKVIGDMQPRYHALDIDSLNGNQMDTQAALDD